MYRKKPYYYNRGGQSRYATPAELYEDEWQDRFTPPGFPKFKIRFETEHHYGYINLRLKEEKCGPDSIRDLCNQFFLVTGNKIALIERFDKNQTQVKQLFRLSEQLPSDLNLERHVKYVINFIDTVSIIVNTKEFNPDTTIELLRKYFLDTMGRAFCTYKVANTYSSDVVKWQLKTKQHKAYNLPQQDSVGSPIEEIFEKALSKAGAIYKKQVKIHIDGEVFTIPDFLIYEHKIAIYCDGTEFHSDTQRIIKDKQQDRYLQSQGYTVLRFSGSEIIKNPEQCAREVVQFIKK